MLYTQRYTVYHDETKGYDSVAAQETEEFFEMENNGKNGADGSINIGKSNVID